MRRPRDLGKQTTPYSAAGENTHRDAEIPPTSERGLKGLRNRLVAPSNRKGYKIGRTHATEKGTP